MARPVKETPVLMGKDAERFSKIIKENEHKTVCKSDYERAEKAYSNFKVVNTVISD